MRLSRDRFEGCTHVFESHHHDYKRARAVLAKYKVPTEVALATVRYRPAKPPQYQLNGRDGPAVHGAQLDADTHPKLLGDGAFTQQALRNLLQHNDLGAHHPTKDAFKAYDPNDTGFVDTDMLRTIFSSLGYGEITDDDLAVLIETADTDCDGRISLDDFRAMCARRILLRPRSLRLSFANPVRKAAHGSA